MTRISDLIDAVMDGYVSWREESAAVRPPTETGARRGPTRKRSPSTTTSPALDREEHAASEYRRLVELAEAA